MATMSGQTTLSAGAGDSLCAEKEIGWPDLWTRSSAFVSTPTRAIRFEYRIS